MPRYRVLRKSYIPRAPGEMPVLINPETEDPFITFNGRAGDNLQLVDEHGNAMEADVSRVAAEAPRGPRVIPIPAEDEEPEAAAAPRVPVAPPLPPRAPKAPPPPKRGPGRPPKR
jgi:hypothetical protein